MTDLITNKLATKDLVNVKELLLEKKVLKRQLRSIDRKLKTVCSNFKFLENIVSINGKDDTIENAAKLLFKKMGFTDIKTPKGNPKTEDIQIWLDDCLILIECKGLSQSNPRITELEQVRRYIELRKSENELQVFGLTLVNHDNTKLFTQRNKTPFDKSRIDFAKSGKYGLLTTIELVKGFTLWYNKDITTEHFINKLKGTGEIKF